MKRAQLQGRKFHRLLVLSFHDVRKGHSRWVVRCDCGTVKILPITSLLGAVKSCGCMSEEVRRSKTNKFRTHGMSTTPTYGAWRSMLKRCSGSQPRYKRDYADRNIRVCERWKTFEFFFSDMGVRPPGMTLERKDNSKGYSLENCVWGDMVMQSRNRRTTVLNEEKVRHILTSSKKGAALAREMGVSAWVIYNVRQRRSWKNVIPA